MHRPIDRKFKYAQARIDDFKTKEFGPISGGAPHEPATDVVKCVQQWL